MTESEAQHLSTLMGIARGYQRSQALAVAAELGLADLPRAGPRRIEDLAAETGTDERALCRLRAHPAVRGILAEQAHVLVNALPVLEAARVADRVTLVECDFFTAVPVRAASQLT